MWTWSGFGMVLDGENRKRFVTEARHRVVVEIDVGDLDFGRQRFGVDGESVIVRSDLDLAGGEIFYRLVSAAMPELEFVSFAAERRPDQLMPQANTKDRRFRFGKLLLDDFPFTFQGLTFNIRRDHGETHDH